MELFFNSAERKQCCSLNQRKEERKKERSPMVTQGLALPAFVGGVFHSI